MNSKGKFTTLDGLRGIAALCVMAFHYRDQPDLMGHNFQPFFNGGATVDLFFVLSGFVLAYAYEGRFAAGLSTGRFMFLRLVRLYPLYLVGTILAIGTESILWWRGYYIHAMSFRGFVTDAILALLFLPKLWPGSRFYPLNFPAWSLLLEVIANLLYRAGFRWLNRPALIGIIALSFIGILIFPDYNDLGLLSFPFFLSRVGFSFFAGVLTYRLWLISDFRPQVSPWILAIALIGLLSLNDRQLSYLLFPVLVYLGACVEPKGFTASLFSGLGAMSYGVYMLQIPVQEIVRLAWPKLVHIPMEHLAPWISLPVMALVMISAWVLDRFYDRPFRAWLSGLGRRRVAVPDGMLARRSELT